MVPGEDRRRGYHRDFFALNLRIRRIKKREEDGENEEEETLGDSRTASHVFRLSRAHVNLSRRIVLYMQRKRILKDKIIIILILFSAVLCIKR